MRDPGFMLRRAVSVDAPSCNRSSSGLPVQVAPASSPAEAPAPIAKETTPLESTSTNVSADAKAKPRRRVVSVMKTC